MKINLKWGGGGRIKFFQPPFPLRQGVSWLWSMTLFHYKFIKLSKIRQGDTCISRENSYGTINSNKYRYSKHRLTQIFPKLTIASLPGACIMAGDFNCTLDPQKYKSAGVDQSHSRSRSVIHHFMKEMSLFDVWREDNPNSKKKKNIHVTPVHTSHTRA